MKKKLINMFFDSYEEYEEVADYIKAILIIAPISLAITFIIRMF